jgi:hypothetical protein
MKVKRIDVWMEEGGDVVYSDFLAPGLLTGLLQRQQADGLNPASVVTAALVLLTMTVNKDRK